MQSFFQPASESERRGIQEKREEKGQDFAAASSFALAYIPLSSTPFGGGFAGYKTCKLEQGFVQLIIGSPIDAIFKPHFPPTSYKYADNL